MRACTLAFAGRTGPAQWSLEGDRLALVPAGGAPLPVPLAEVAGLAGDGYAIALRLGGAEVALSKLGAEGPTLLEQLHRTWPPLRAAALRLSGRGEPARFAGAADLGGGPAPARLLLFDDLLLAFREGEDAHPLFLALQAGVAHDAEAYTLSLEGTDGSRALFSRLGGATEAFAAALAAARAALARQADEALTGGLPTLGPLQRAALAGAWLPGRLLSLAAAETLAQGASAAVLSSWCAACPRAREGKLLLEGVAPEESFVAFTPPDAAVGAATEEPEETPAPAQAETAEPAAPAPLPEGLWPLWLLVRRGGGWYLESLGETDRATYRFAGGEEVPELCSRLLCAPQFSREALYQPLEKLVGEKAAFALPARELPFLRALRARFKGRVLHTSAASWKKGIV